MKTIVGTSSDLSVIGLPIGFQNESPSADSFPNRFNKKAVGVWQSIFEAGFMDLSGLSTDNQWRLSIKNYVSQCNLLGINPFEIKNDTTTNNSIVNFLTTARRRITRLIDRTEIFPNFLRIRSIKRESTNTENGLSITTKAHTYGVQDQPTFIKHLLDHGFRKRSEFKYDLYISPNIKFEIQILNSSRVFIKYTVEILTKVYTGEPLSKNDFNEFVNKKLWLPVVRANRFATYPRITLL